MQSPYSPMFTLGFEPRMNKVTRFRELFDLCREHQGMPADAKGLNPDWVGVPLPFYVPVLSFMQTDTGQMVAVNAYTFSLMIVERNKDTIYIENKDGYVRMAVSYAYGPDDYRLVLSSMATSEDGVTRRVEDLLVMPGTDDVEQILSCYLSLYEMQKLNIRSLKLP